MLAKRRPDEQVYVGPKSVSNVGPTESTTKKLRWPNVVMLSGHVSPAAWNQHFRDCLFVLKTLVCVESVLRTVPDLRN